MTEEKQEEGKGISAAVLEAAETAKKAGYKPIYITCGGSEYVYRGVTRAEWRTHINERNKVLAALPEDDLVAQAEAQEHSMETLVAFAIIYPATASDTLPAGVIQTLADGILLASGFDGPDGEPIEL